MSPEIERVRRGAPIPEVIQVIQVVFVRGKGVEGDPVRQVTTYHALDGTFLAESDPVPATSDEWDPRVSERRG